MGLRLRHPQLNSCQSSEAASASPRRSRATLRADDPAGVSDHCSGSDSVDVSLGAHARRRGEAGARRDDYADRSGRKDLGEVLGEATAARGPVCGVRGRSTRNSGGWPPCRSRRASRHHRDRCPAIASCMAVLRSAQHGHCGRPTELSVIQRAARGGTTNRLKIRS